MSGSTSRLYLTLNGVNSKMSKNASSKKANVEGSWWAACMPSDYIKASKQDFPDGKVNNYEDLALIKDIFGDGINNYADVDEWITEWGSDIETQENFIMQVGCHV